jgi:hypothetical protein
MAAFVGCGGQDQPTPEPEAARAQRVIDTVERPVERLQDALEQARPQSRSSMVQVRAAAARAADRLEGAADDLRTLNRETATEDDRSLSDAEDALNALARLATALTARTPSVARIEDTGAQASLAVKDLDALRVPELNADSLVAALRRDRRRHAPTPPTSPRDTPDDSVGGSTFNTGRDPGDATAAAHCRAVPDELRCWTPNDGFTVVLDKAGARRDRASEAGNRGYEPASPQIRAGERWTSEGFSCEAGGRALTCTNAAGRGFTLPRYRGLPSYF